jgi:hypothetical protein
MVVNIKHRDGSGKTTSKKRKTRGGKPNKPGTKKPNNPKKPLPKKPGTKQTRKYTKSPKKIKDVAQRKASIQRKTAAAKKKKKSK